MSFESEIEAKAQEALRDEPRLERQAGAVRLRFADGTMTMEGELDSLPARKLALRCVAHLPGVAAIVDRLKVRPAERQDDRQIRERLRRALLQEPAFARLAIRETEYGTTETIQEPADAPQGEICFQVDDAVALLNGTVPGLSYKRLAGVLAWWSPGCRDVVNGLAVAPEEADSDEEVSDAIRLVLDKDPFVDAARISISAVDYVVTLQGVVPKEAERDMAEFDAWAVFGVDAVANRLEVHS